MGTSTDVAFAMRAKDFEALRAASEWPADGTLADELEKYKAEIEYDAHGCVGVIIKDIPPSNNTFGFLIRVLTKARHLNIPVECVTCQQKPDIWHESLATTYIGYDKRLTMHISARPSFARVNRIDTDNRPAHNLEHVIRTVLTEKYNVDGCDDFD